MPPTATATAPHPPSTFLRLSKQSRVAWRVVNAINGRLFHHDRRTSFRDMSKLPPEGRQARSRVINFYSAVHNIGNYLPLLAMHPMLGEVPDTWNIHDKRLDFSFVNANYSAAIIGGAGLLEAGFEPFWERFGRECRLPTIVWGVGTCAPDKGTARGVSPQAAGPVLARCDLVNVRDDLTANFYDLRNASVTPCPTIVYVRGFVADRDPVASTILYSSHEELLNQADKTELRRRLDELGGTVAFTDNIQRPLDGIEDIIRDRYCRSRLVVTTRLHGAITAYGMGIPYIAIPHDDKLRFFQRHYGNGCLVENLDDLSRAVQHPPPLDRPVQYEQVEAFGQQARAWLTSVR